MAIRKQTALSLRPVINQLLRCVLLKNKSRIQGSKRIARTIYTITIRAAVTAVASHPILRRGYLNKLLGPVNCSLEGRAL